MKLSLLARAVSAALCVPAALHPAYADEPVNAKADVVSLDDVNVSDTSALLDIARNGLSTDTGSTIYAFDNSDIANLPLGASTPLNQVILQAPGVVQDSFGQLHVRGDHGNVQYRINGVVIPEAISGFGQSLDTRFVDRLDILTGALPAQYGYRTAGVVDIHTKGSGFRKGGSLDLTVGSHDDREAGLNFTGSNGGLSYFLSGSYLRNELGIENPTPERNAIHDLTKQGKGFGYLSYILSDQSRVSLMFGASDSRFQIPNVPGEASSYTLNGMTDIDSTTLDANQREKNRFEVLSYQSRTERGIDYQISGFHRYTDVHYVPDEMGDLMFNGLAARILRRDETAGLQFDASYHIGKAHTVRTGLFYNNERFNANNDSLVFPADADGNQTDDVPISIADRSRITGHTVGVYLQDEWQPLTALTINYGARFDKVKTVVDEQQFSPRVGLVYELTTSTRVHAGYARYFTPPPTERIDTTSIEKFLGTTNALPSDANTAVSSERSHYYDIGIAQQVTPQITLGLDAYYRQVKNLQDEGQFGNALIFSAFNFEKAKIWGTELSTTYRGDNLSAYVNVAYSVGQARNLLSGQFNFDGDEIDYINNNWVNLDHDQTWSGSAGISYKWRATTLSADAVSGSGMRRGFANTDHMPGYAQFNVAAVHGFEFENFGKLDARIAVINVLDRQYPLRDGSGIGVGAPQYAPRRALYVGLSKTF